MRAKEEVYKEIEVLRERMENLYHEAYRVDSGINLGDTLINGTKVFKVVSLYSKGRSAGFRGVLEDNDAYLSSNELASRWRNI